MPLNECVFHKGQQQQQKNEPTKQIKISLFYMFHNFSLKKLFFVVDKKRKINERKTSLVLVAFWLEEWFTVTIFGILKNYEANISAWIFFAQIFSSECGKWNLRILGEGKVGS